MKMKKIAFKNKNSLKHRRRIFTISEQTDSKDCTTLTHKRFIYVIDKKVDGKINAANKEKKPHFYVIKIHDSKKKIEKFYFWVKGSMYVIRDRRRFRVHYRHSLKIDIQWKDKMASFNLFSQ